MQKYITKINMDFLQNIHTGYYHTPIMYFHKNIGVRWLFWERLNQISKIIQKNDSMKKTKCIDFGGGSGIFLPTLAKLFDEVILVDLEPSQAEIIIKEYNLTNCKIIKGNIFELTFKNIDCIIAADVIEHFDNTLDILNQLKTFMNNDTSLITSLPTENWLYVLLRKIFKQEKPVDHYYGSEEIEKVFRANGLKSTYNKNIPICKPFNLFAITEWKINR
ncbi:MAG: methyltransferase domain-containing protein [Helicobacteraceae bacterium]|nr:methyltransferase domain-containing protein [Helicobacteraceae bacterium]